MGKLTDEERRAIEAFDGEKTVRRRGGKQRPAPRVNWGEIPRQSPGSRVMDRRPAKTREPRAMSVQRMLEWAFRDECASLELPERDAPEDRGTGFGMEYVLLQRARLGGSIDCSAGAKSDPHEDAEAVAAITSNLPDIVGGRRMAIRVSEIARAGTTPDWMPGATPRYEAKEWHQNTHGRWAGTESLGEYREVVRGKRKTTDIRWCPVVLRPDPAVIARVRADYVDWWFALSEIRRNIAASGMLRQHSITNVMPPMAPWEKNLDFAK